ncbi:MAG: hypothetical protein A2Y03_01740 [Omnitrophica WOR_2 bacterium GWF2_38_59]|nr:MAG: hypothetical protein A2Y06_04105 [Omnitrophica WOR_2 bacterium GWA2_37_7]OGX25764.1 MAG: hypothetical protein A2Y03_01740 [Omnitrophica WOR_2 bacterium GWF2_38_59]OGX48348.1 MAG: hypothetical protein A2243_07865 [Omnitrophica WOR_2 bacterium RIFOXYA2_FULL_38_17]OGX54751.1 MAG: hypothetical protein A2267_06025 [Omnitrophica WOR_2 bacterium RIFOXYA12_FULL_38_10]OGX55089.1 MAG: hypothetical protein A2447_02840 [Omnitrophica WOR_2 bacterium RIFOXYC2_FULL_38_12]OGX58077.1 MAG: hypothetical 
MKNFLNHLKLYIFRGLMALIPIGLTIFTIRIIYIFIDKRVMGQFEHYIGYRVPGLGLLLFIIVLYFTGLIASNVLGSRLFSLLEGISNRIPIVKMTYQIGKQLSNTLSLSEKQIFNKAVLVEYFKSDTWVIGFVTGELRDDKTGKNLLKVFIPTVPNPTSGFLVIMKESQVKDPHWSVEEAMKMVISGGIIGPNNINVEYK